MTAAMIRMMTRMFLNWLMTSCSRLAVSPRGERIRAVLGEPFFGFGCRQAGFSVGFQFCERRVCVQAIEIRHEIASQWRNRRCSIYCLDSYAAQPPDLRGIWK
ncbi:MAG: hypothetical protein U0521_11815 [Anaerolineae bacterium]